MIDKSTKEIETFRSALWRATEKASEGLSSTQIIRSLESITDSVYGAGIDDAYDSIGIKRSYTLAIVWDCMWLSSWIKELRREQLKNVYSRGGRLKVVKREQM